MDTTDTPSDALAKDPLEDSVMDSMAAALESAGISLEPDAPEIQPEKRYSDEVMRQVANEKEIQDFDGFVVFAKSMDGDENGYLNKQELLDAAEAWEHLNSPEDEEQISIEEEVNALLQAGEESSRKNDSKSALASFNKAISLDPSCDMAWFNRGVLLEAQQDARGARQAFQICLDLNEEHAPATANLAILLERIGDEAGAYDMAKKSTGILPRTPNVNRIERSL
jgi:tetratricopeptide (TPR) repeat protein